VEIKPRASLFASRVTPDHGPTKESTVVISRMPVVYVEKNTRGFSVPVADFPKEIGAGLAEMGFFFARTVSSCSILRCSCETGRFGRIMTSILP